MGVLTYTVPNVQVGYIDSSRLFLEKYLGIVLCYTLRNM